MRFPALMCGLAAASLCFGSIAEGATRSQRSKPKTTATAKKAKKSAKKGKKAEPAATVAPLVAEPAIAPLTPPKSEQSDAAVAPLVMPSSQTVTAPAPAAATKPETRTVEAFGAEAPKPEAVQEPKPLPAPAEPTVAAAPIAPLVTERAEPAAERASFHVTPFVGVGTTVEPEVGESTQTFGFGLALEYAFTNDASLMLSARDQLYRRDYVSTRPDLSLQGPARSSLDEHKLAADLLFAYELPGLFGFEQPWLRLAVLVGPSGRYFLNESMRSQAAAVAAGLRASFAFSDQLDLSLQGIYGYNLLPYAIKDQEQLSAMGGPLAYGTYGASLGLRLAPGTRFGIGYDGELVVLEKSVRLYHSLAFVFDVAL